MGAVLRRAAFSPNIKERADCSAALFTPAGELLAQAEHIPVHLGSMPASVRAALDAFGDRVRPGDQIILNDPFAGGTHLNDITLVAPCFTDDGRLVGWAANRAHHADVGGMAPGSIPPEATEVYQEGLRIPPVLLTPEVEAILFANSRTGAERRGDLDAQRGANQVGVARLAALAGAPLDEVVAYGERRMRAALAGAARRHAGPSRTSSTPPAPAPTTADRPAIALTLTIDGETATFDFTGTDEQRPGNVNAVEAVTVSAVAFALRSATDPTIPANGGAMRPVTIVAPPGTLVAARPPAAVGAGNVEVSQRVADVCFGALAQACPDRVAAAGQGTMNNLLIGGDGWVYYETIAGGQGARPDRGDGPPRHERRPHRDDQYEEHARSRPWSGRFRCGCGATGCGGGAAAPDWLPAATGIERDLEMLEDCTVSLITERRVSRPWGLAGGGPGAVGENWLLRGGDESRAERFPTSARFGCDAGDVLRMLTPGGGGWGEPSEGERPRARPSRAGPRCIWRRSATGRRQGRGRPGGRRGRGRSGRRRSCSAGVRAAARSASSSKPPVSATQRRAITTAA